MPNPRHGVSAIVVGLALCLPPRLAAAAPEDPSSAAPSTPPSDAASEPAPTGDGVQNAQEEARQLRAEAEQRFFENDYDGALSAFQRAYELSPHPTDLFNMGRIHEEKGELAAALTRYEEFVTQPRIRLDERAAAAERIKVLRVLVEDEAGNDRRSARGRDDRAFSADGSNTDDLSRMQRDREAAARVGRPLIVSGAVFAALGAAIGLGGGLSFGLLARRQSDRIDALGDGRNPDRLTLSDAEELDARGKDYETLQIASLATGVTLAGVGTGLLVVGLVRRHRAQARLEALVPDVTPSMVGLSTLWRF